MSLAIVAEAPADREIASALGDRVFCEEISWLRDQPELLAHCRAWRGLEEHDTYLDWHHVHRLARDRNIRVLGKFGDRGAMPDAQVARKALLLLHGSSRR